MASCHRDNEAPVARHSHKMDTYRHGVLHMDHVSLENLVASFHTPFYVYSKRRIEENVRSIQEGLHYSNNLLCYSVNANYSLGILNVFAHLGTGFEVASLEELERVIKVGGDAQKIVLSGPGKSMECIMAAITHNIYCIHAESWQELDRIEVIARTKQKVVPVGIRVNPVIDAGVHAYLAVGHEDSKFGFSSSEAESAFVRVHKSQFMKIIGISYHVGSQILAIEPFLVASRTILKIVDNLKAKGVTLLHVDIGGGFGVPHRQTDDIPCLASWVRQIAAPFEKRGLRVLCEPGRGTIADAGVLITRVEYVKKNGDKTFLIVDAGMNDFMRPALYGAYHEVKAVREGVGNRSEKYDIVGPICECGDFFAKGRCLPQTAQGDVLAIMTAGAYGFAMSSNYNSRNQLREVLVDGPKVYVIREPQTLEQQIVNERLVKLVAP